jgi:hypothetical protein
MDDGGFPVDGRAYAEVEVEIRALGYLDNILYQDAITKRIDVGSGLLSASEQGTDDFVFEMPLSVYSLELRYQVTSYAQNKPYDRLGATSYAGASAGAEITFNNVVAETLPIKEFISPLGASWYNYANDKRVTIDREEGRVIQSSMVIEDPATAQKVYGVVESGQLRFKRENGTIITSWNI